MENLQSSLPYLGDDTSKNMNSIISVEFIDYVPEADFFFCGSKWLMACDRRTWNNQIACVPGVERWRLLKLAAGHHNAAERAG
jgi:hypothetical protein